MWSFCQELKIPSTEGGETLNSTYFIEDWWLVIPISYLLCWSKISGEYLECRSWSNMIVCSVVHAYDIYDMPLLVHFNPNHFQMTWCLFTIGCITVQNHSLFHFRERMGVFRELQYIIFLWIPSPLPPFFLPKLTLIRSRIGNVLFPQVGNSEPKCLWRCKKNINRGKPADRVNIANLWIPRFHPASSRWLIREIPSHSSGNECCWVRCWALAKLDREDLPRLYLIEVRRSQCHDQDRHATLNVRSLLAVDLHTRYRSCRSPMPPLNWIYNLLYWKHYGFTNSLLNKNVINSLLSVYFTQMKAIGVSLRSDSIHIFSH